MKIQKIFSTLSSSSFEGQVYYSPEHKKKKRTAFSPIISLSLSKHIGCEFFGVFLILIWDLAKNVQFWFWIRKFFFRIFCCCCRLWWRKCGRRQRKYLPKCFCIFTSICPVALALLAVSNWVATIMTTCGSFLKKGWSLYPTKAWLF